MAFKGAEKLHEEITVRDNVGRLFNRNKTHYVAAPLEMTPSLHKIGREKAVVQSPIVKNEAAREEVNPAKGKEKDAKPEKPKKTLRSRIGDILIRHPWLPWRNTPKTPKAQEEMEKEHASLIIMAAVLSLFLLLANLF